jgi:hypothetical protein
MDDEQLVAQALPCLCGPQWRRSGGRGHAPECVALHWDDIIDLLAQARADEWAAMQLGFDENPAALAWARHRVQFYIDKARRFSGIAAERGDADKSTRLAGHRQLRRDVTDRRPELRHRRV